MKKTPPQYDYLLFLCTILLFCIGLVFIYSASSNLSLFRFNDPYFYLKKQIVFGLLGIFAMMFGMVIPSESYSDKKIVFGIFFISIGLLLSLFFIGHTVNGATRWIRIGPVSFQPTELAKFSLCLYLSYSMASKGVQMRLFKKGVLHHFIIFSIFAALILKQPDHGSVAMILMWLFIMLFVGGARITHLIIMLIFLVPIALFCFWHSPYLICRWKAFRNPWEYADTYGFQIIHSLYAFGTGGLFGVGLGSGKQKLFYLPEPHTDFILSVIGEEVGFLGVAIIIVLYALIVTKGIKVAIDTKNLFNKYLAFGISCMLGIQVLINMAVVTNLIPAKGITLPLLSYGGSSLLFTMFQIGILLNVSSKR